MNATDMDNSVPIKLTSRWSTLRPHPVQSRLFHDTTRFKIVPAGRRSGKTELAKRKLVLSLIDRHPRREPKPWSDPRYFAAAPTREQAKMIFWNDLKALVPRNWVRRIYETDLCITTRWGAELWVRGLDKPERIEGSPWDGGVIDELANCKPGIWNEHIRPALADREGWCWLIGVPDRDAPAQAEYKKMYEAARDGVNPEWAAYTWPSSDILPAEEVEAMRQTMPHDTFEQELGGKFLIAGGLAFPAFHYKLHVNDDIARYDPSLPLCWSLDFNVNPMCSGLIQHHKGIVRVIHEFRLIDSSTDVACDAFIDYCNQHQINTNNVYLYGDSTGNARDSTSGVSDWMIIQNRLKNLGPSLRVPRGAPLRKDTVNAVRAKLKNAKGDASLYINSSCRQLISDLQEAIWPDHMEAQHALAWLRYFCHREYPVLVDFDIPIGKVRSAR